MGLVDRFRTGKLVRILRSGPTAPASDLAEAKESLVEMGPSALEPVLECLGSPGNDAALDVLGRLLTTETLPEFIQALSSPDRRVSSGVRQVMEIGRNYRASDLIPYLSEPDVPNVRLEPVLTARVGDLDAAELIAALPDLHRDARTIVYRLVEKAADPSLAPHAIRLLSHSDWWIRYHMAALLAQMPGPDSESGLSAILSDPNKSVRLQAVKSLSALGAKSAIPFLANTLRDGDLKVQAAAIDALIRIGDPSAVPHLVDVLKDESEQCRRGAVEVLNEVATAEAIQDLVHALRDADWWVRVRSADALGTIGGEKVVEAILSLMQDEDVHIRRYAVEILNTVPDGKSVDSLVAALDDEDWWVRERSIDALGRSGDSRAVRPLRKILLTDPDAAPLCAKALGEIQDPAAVDALLKALIGNPAEELRRTAVASLQKLSRLELPPAKRTKLEDALRGVGVRVEKTRLQPMAVRTGGAAAPSSSPMPSDDGPMGNREHAPAPRHPDAPAPPPPPEDRKAKTRAADLQPGDMLLDRYRVEERIGSGGFSTVFLVEDTAIQEAMILKILSQNLSVEENSLARFVQELKLARKIAHPNVIRIHDLLEIDDARAISMEYFSGLDLGKILDKEKKLDPDRARTVSLQIAQGLAAAHDQGIIHRDVKPANILVDECDRVKIVDFGLAAATREAENRLTRTGHLVGTPHYMAPELIRGDEVDGRADLYSLGVMMYEMLSGSLPYDGDNPMNVLFRHLDGDAIPLTEVTDVPPDLAALVMRLMSLEREDRFQSAHALADALHEPTP
jgi:serine/threonine-protein kinase